MPRAHGDALGRLRFGTRVGPSASQRAPLLVGAGSLLVACVYLLTRLVPDIGDKPLQNDEAVAGNVATLPFPELVTTVIVDRGGPPFHYMASHAALLIQPTPEMLRSLSVVFALGAVIVCYDLGRRIAGHAAGAAAALVAATSAMLEAYGTFGRMYAAFAFAAALAADTFYRALVLRTSRAALVAGAAALLVAATHTYGTFLLVVEAGIALVLWRGRPLRAGLPLALLGLTSVPLLLASVRLSERFEVSVGGEESLTSSRTAARQLYYALGGFSGGRQILALFVALAGFGAVLILLRQPAFLALWIAVLAPPVLYLLVSSSGSVESPRHLIYGLPLWAAQIGAGFAYITARFPLVLQAILLAAIGLVGAAFHGPVGDPRGATDFGSAIGSREALAGPAAWLAEQVEPTDVLFDDSPAFLAALETTRSAVTIAPGSGGLLERGLEDVDFPVSAVVVPLPLASAGVDLEHLREQLGDRAEISRTQSWLLVRSVGPFSNEAQLLRAVYETLEAEWESLRHPPPDVRAHLRGPLGAACRALALEERRDQAFCRRPSSTGR